MVSKLQEGGEELIDVIKEAATAQDNAATGGKEEEVKRRRRREVENSSTVMKEEELKRNSVIVSKLQEGGEELIDVIKEAATAQDNVVTGGKEEEIINQRRKREVERSLTGTKLSTGTDGNSLDTEEDDKTVAGGKVKEANKWRKREEKRLIKATNFATKTESIKLGNTGEANKDLSDAPASYPDGIIINASMKTLTDNIDSNSKASPGTMHEANTASDINLPFMNNENPISLQSNDKGTFEDKIANSYDEEDIANARGNSIEHSDFEDDKHSSEQAVSETPATRRKEDQLDTNNGHTGKLATTKIDTNPKPPTFHRNTTKPTSTSIAKWNKGTDTDLGSLQSDVPITSSRPSNADTSDVDNPTLKQQFKNVSIRAQLDNHIHFATEEFSDKEVRVGSGRHRVKRSEYNV